MSEREIVSAERLIEILNLELSQREECAGCTFHGVLQKLDEPYADGGNWSRSIAIRGRPANPDAAGHAAADVIEILAMRFNLP